MLSLNHNRLDSGKFMLKPTVLLISISLNITKSHKLYLQSVKSFPNKVIKPVEKVAKNMQKISTKETQRRSFQIANQFQKIQKATGLT